VVDPCCKALNQHWAVVLLATYVFVVCKTVQMQHACYFLLVYGCKGGGRAFLFAAHLLLPHALQAGYVMYVIEIQPCACNGGGARTRTHEGLHGMSSLAITTSCLHLAPLLGLTHLSAPPGACPLTSMPRQKPPPHRW
jgi:hypothetical protein